MKGIKLGIIAFLLGELFVISEKDKRFSSTLKKKTTTRGKIQYLATTLFDFNKKLAKKAGIQAKKIDTKQTIGQAKKRAEKEYDNLQTKLNELEKKLNSLDKKTITQTLSKAEKKYSAISKKVQAIVKKTSKTYHLEEKLLEIQDHITKIRSKLS